MDEELEKAIDKAGREKVFAVARNNGWRAGECVPKYIWWVFVNMVLVKDNIK